MESRGRGRGEEVQEENCQKDDKFYERDDQVDGANGGDSAGGTLSTCLLAVIY